jgi:hypothetical protein
LSKEVFVKAKIVSGNALAVAAIALALSAAAVTPAFAKGHVCTMEKGQCGGKMKCMTKKGVCKHGMKHHKGSCGGKHHCKSH